MIDESGHEVAEHALQRDADAETDDADPGHEGRDLESELVERDHHREEHDDQPEDTDGEHP